MEKVKRVLVSPGARELIERLRQEHGPLLFHQSGGCCDGSAPMCFPQSEFRTGSGDIRVGEIAGCPFYMSDFQFEYWQHCQLTIDVTPGRGSSFSLEIPLGLRFVVKSRLFTGEEAERLEPVWRADA